MARRIFRALLLSLIAALTIYNAVLINRLQQRAPAAAPVSESAYDRMMRTNTIRCGYILYEPMVRKDANTGAFSGIAVDLATELGKLLNVKFEWTEEVGWGTAIEGLRTGRYDALCVGFWRLAAEGKYLYYTEPFAYSHDEILVRADDSRFDNNLAALNDKTVRIVSGDGMEASRIAQRDFPLAQLIELPNMQGDTDLMQSVAGDKADVTFIEAATSERYLAANPGKLKVLPLPAPIRLFQNTFALPQDARLKATLDTALNELIENGGINLILDKYDPRHALLLRVKRPALQ